VSTLPCNIYRTSFVAVHHILFDRGWYVVLLVTLDIAYTCKKFEDSSKSYSWGIPMALIFKVDHVTWPRPFQRQFVVLRLGLSMINLHTKFQVSMITCNEDMKGNAKCKNSLQTSFDRSWILLAKTAKLRGTRVMHRVHLWLEGKCSVDFLLMIIELFSLALRAQALLSESCRNQRFLKGESLSAPISGWWGHRHLDR